MHMLSNKHFDLKLKMNSKKSLISGKRDNIGTIYTERK